VPNPFNPATTLGFALASPGRVVMSVYDPAGRLVRRLVDGHRSAGPHEVVWDGRDDAGRSLPSGTYLVRLEQGDGASVRRVTLLK
jgi:flagellar hook assembly protein FlgD